MTSEQEQKVGRLAVEKLPLEMIFPNGRDCGRTDYSVFLLQKAIDVQFRVKNHILSLTHNLSSIKM